MNDDDDYVEVYEMAGTVIEWDGHGGYLLSDDGDRVLLTRWMLSRQGVTVPLKVGDRLHCWVREEITYRLEKIRVIEPMEPDADRIRELKERGKAIAARQRGRLWADGQFCETFAGTIESYSARKKKGVIRRDDGECMSFDGVSLTGLRCTRIKPGMPIRFQAFRFLGRWAVVRVLSLDNPLH